MCFNDNGWVKMAYVGCKFLATVKLMPNCFLMNLSQA